jgi:hypothetical protein
MKAPANNPRQPRLWTAKSRFFGMLACAVAGVYHAHEKPTITKDQDIRQLVERVSQSDTSEVVRQQASRLLEQLKSELNGARISNK